MIDVYINKGDLLVVSDGSIQQQPFQWQIHVPMVQQRRRDGSHAQQAAQVPIRYSIVQTAGSGQGDRGDETDGLDQTIRPP